MQLLLQTASSSLIFSIAAMQEPQRPEKTRSRARKGSKATLFFVFGLAVVLSLTVFLFFRHKHVEIVNLFEKTGSVAPSSGGRLDKLSSDKASTTSDPRTSATPPPLSQSQGDSPENIQSSVTPRDGSLNREVGADSSDTRAKADNSSADTSKPTDPYQQLVEELNAFYAHLDQQPYMLDFHLKEPSKTHFSKLLQTLIDNPPVITKETDDYFTLLKNTAHFFRILGKENIFILKGILDREKDSFERIVKIFYTLTDHPQYLKEAYSLTIPKENLYDYAGFFLNTIGGRLYLFRRDSTSRMTISYYAVLIIDKAHRQGNSRLGIDLRPSIDSLIDEMENTGKNLKQKEEYLDTLYDLKEMYSNRG